MKKLKDSTVLSEEQKAKIRKALGECLGAADNSLVCPMCGHNTFMIANGYCMSILQNHIKKVELDGLSIPTVAIICDSCGFISEHSMGILGLLEPKESQLRFMRLLTSQAKRDEKDAI